MFFPNYAEVFLNKHKYYRNEDHVSQVDGME